MTDPLTPLISRLEQATGPDRDLDAAIEIATGRAPHTPVDWPGWEKVCPAYTASLDAAVSLVPEGWRWLLDKRPWGDRRADGYRADVYSAPICHFGETETWASTPAIALCIAALKAIQAQRQESEDAETTQ